jgi:hypothetical protein
MRQNRKLFAILAVAAFWLLGAGVPSAKAVFLSDLLAGGSITVGDLTFSNWTYQPPDGPPLPTTITITPFTDGQGNIGIQIGGGFSQTIPPTINPLDVRIGYTVTTTGPGISGVNLSGNPAISPIGATGAVVVTESVTPAGGTTLAPIQIYAINNISGQPVTQASDALVFANGASYTSLDVVKDILLTSGTGVPSISFINQTFVTPEPGSVMLMGLGCLGMVGYGLKRRSTNG